MDTLLQRFKRTHQRRGSGRRRSALSPPTSSKRDVAKTRDEMEKGAAAKQLSFDPAPGVPEFGRSPRAGDVPSPVMYSLLPLGGDHQMVASCLEQPSTVRPSAAAQRTTDLEILLVRHAERASAMASLLEQVEVSFLRFACAPESACYQETAIPWAERLDALRQRLTAEVARTYRLLTERPAAMRVSRANVAVLMPGSNPVDVPQFNHSSGNGACGNG